MGLELRVGPAGYPWYYLQVHRVLHMLRGSASLSEGSEEEEVSTALRWASERGVSGREDVGKPRPQSSECHTPGFILSAPGSGNPTLIHTPEEGQGSLRRL